MPFAPSDISGLKIWLKADAGAGSSDNDPVGTWTDQSGTSHNFTGSGSARPTYKTAIRNGLAVVRFDGTDDELDGGNLSSVFTTGASVFAAANFTGGSGSRTAYESGQIDAWWSFAGSGYWGPFRTIRLSNTPSSGLPTSGWHLWSMTADNGSNYKVWLDTVIQINDTGGFTFGSANQQRIGRQHPNGDYQSMDYGELIVYDSALGTTDRQSVEAYLNERWLAVSASSTPSVVAGIGAVASSTVTGAAFATPAAVAGIGTIPAPAPFGNPHFVQDSATFNTTAGNKSASLTPSAGALLIVVCALSGTATDPTSVADDQGGTYTQAGKAVRGGTAHAAWVYVRDQLVASAVAHAVTMTSPGGDNGGGLDVQEFYGFHRVGSTAVVQVAKQDNQSNAGGVAPQVTFGQALQTTNVVVGGLTVAQNPATGTPPSGFTERQDVGWNTPTAGVESVTADNGQTGTTVTWGGIITAGVGFGALLVEFDTRAAAPNAVAGIGAVPAPTAVGQNPATVTPINTIGFSQVPGPVVSSPASASPAAVVGTGAVPAVTAKANGIAVPTVTVGVGAVPAASGSGAATGSPVTTVGVGAVPTPTVIGAGSGNANPITVVGVGAVPAATSFGAASSLPSTTVGVGAVPAATGKGTSTAVPSAVPGTGVVPGPDASGTATVRAMPVNVIGVGQVPRTLGFGQGTGGGGGSSDGSTDFWAIKALG